MRGLEGRFDNPPDVVTFPRSEEEIVDLLQFATSRRLAIIPYGCGSSVVGGVEPPSIEGTHLKGIISIDMKHFDKLLSVDRVCVN